MPQLVYLIRNGDLYKIGRTTRLKSIINKFKPDEIVESLKTKESRNPADHARLNAPSPSSLALRPLIRPVH